MKKSLTMLVLAGLCLPAFGDQPAIDAQLKARLAQQLRAQLAAQGVPVSSGPLRRHLDGSESLRLGADQASIVVATTNPDGTLDTHCVRGVEAAATVLATAAKDPSPEP